MAFVVSVTQVVKRNEVFYTEGTETLKRARLWLCSYSLPRAKRRLEVARAAAENNPEEVVQEEEQLAKRMGVFSNSASQMGDQRSLSAISLTSDGNAVATGSWSGAVKLWQLPDCNETLLLKVYPCIIVAGV